MKPISRDAGAPGIPSTIDKCSVCDQLWHAITGGDNRIQIIVLGHMNELEEHSCSRHRPLLQFIGEHYSASHPYSPLTITYFSGGKFFPSIATTSDLPPSQFLDSKFRIGPKTLGHGRILDVDWVDMDLIKNWMEMCAKLHGDRCANPFKLPQTYPDWLVDTSDSCVVPGDGIPEYVALSYRWGASAGFRAEGLEREAIRRPGALAESHIVDRLPQTIVDAMKLVLSIGERYLWVDALCIDQSDKVHFGRQLEMMGAIYASAKLTIVAADGDATTGIRGLKGISPSRELKQRTLPLSEDVEVIISQKPDFTQESGCEYFRRGWTHQEFVLSKRRLIFAKGQIFWECTREKWYEYMISDVRGFPAVMKPHETNLLDSALVRGEQDLEGLSRILGDYNRRKHSYAEDTLPGIIGLLSIIGRSFNGGFLCGLPETCFDSALMWYTGMGDPSEIRRRVESGKKHSTFPTILPSWSWVGWQTPALQITQGESTFNRVWSRTCFTTPITLWYTQESLNSVTKRLIIPTLLNLRSGSRPANIAGNCSSSTFDDQMPWSPLQTPFISSKTKRGWFTAGRLKPGPKKSTGRLGAWEVMMRLSTERCDDCGVIRPHTGIEVLLGADLAGTPTIELVAICFQELYDWELFDDKEFHKVYGVLWIHWIDGVAYRQGSGFVYKEMWEAHELENIDLILG